jgi:hypothetical protein
MERFHHLSGSEDWIIFNYEDLRDVFTGGCICPSSGLMFRKECFPERWNEEMNIADDWFLLLEIILSKKVRAGFSFQIHWIKSVQEDNVYDGRAEYDINRLLYKEDFRRILQHFRDVLTQQEKDKFLRKYQRSLFQLSFHYLMVAKSKKIGKSVWYATRACTVNPKWSLEYLRNNYPKLKQKFQKIIISQKSKLIKQPSR